ncbi:MULTISPECIES: PsbP-related protein [unclassified Methanoculleus]|jgi:hypothetical protein|uniref:PsbP C-terminal domain-containing protein n=1 Tax=Methanoculleus palmolei TaxID=72612 RepID=A0ABD8AB79_9EURY|nr:hypothetical protein [Methanoculleus sp.]WOX55871.1 hypothetical protein R6Y95_00700 [Methanoculleus palmolei]
MKSQRLLIIGVIIAVALIAVLAVVVLPGLSSPPQPPGPDPTWPVATQTPTSAPTPTPAPVPGNGTYVNATYGYAVTCPEGWFYTESGESVWFSSPDKHEEVRVNTNPLQKDADPEQVLESLNATYAEDLRSGIDAEWVSTEKLTLDGVPGYKSVYSVPLPVPEGDRYDFIIRYAVKDDVIYSVMHTVFPPKYDIYNIDAAPTAESFRFL